MIEVFMGRVSVMTISFSHINFTTNDWLYPCLLGCHIEINNAIHGAVVSDGKAVHAQFLGSGNKLGDVAHAIKQAIFSVDMEVSELWWHRLNYSICHCEHSEAISGKIRQNESH